MDSNKDILDNEIEVRKPRSLTKIFAWAQIAALIGTIVDFLMTIFFTEFFGILYWVSNAIGAAMGAITNFLLGRYWVFEAAHQKIGSQAIRYALVSTGSLILNTSGVYLVTEYFNLHYVASKVIIAVLVAISFNFILQKNFVYK